VNTVGVNAVRQWAARFGFDAQRQPENLTLALGAGATTPLQMATAYAVIANGGWRIAPVVVEKISDAQGQVLYQAPAAPAFETEERAVPARNLFLLQSLLNDVTRIGTAAKAQAQLKRTDLFGKTGTTNDAVDAWFAGFQPGVVGVAWMGYDDPKSLGEGESGGGLALPIWIDTMATMLKGVPVATLTAPDGVAMGTADWRYAEWAEQAPVERIEDSAPR
jgi:penicillin-binding protein 1A